MNYFLCINLTVECMRNKQIATGKCKCFSLLLQCKMNVNVTHNSLQYYTIKRFNKHSANRFRRHKFFKIVCIYFVYFQFFFPPHISVHFIYAVCKFSIASD